MAPNFKEEFIDPDWQSEALQFDSNGVAQPTDWHLIVRALERGENPNVEHIVPLLRQGPNIPQIVRDHLANILCKKKKRGRRPLSKLQKMKSDLRDLERANVYKKFFEQESRIPYYDREKSIHERAAERASEHFAKKGQNISPRYIQNLVSKMPGW